MSTRWWQVAVAVTLAASGCKKNAPTAAGGAGGAATVGETQGGATAAPAIGAVGMEDPFARITGDSPRLLNAGYKALKARKFDDARASFASVVKASPDYTTARWQELRAAVLGAHFADVPDLWRDLLTRDYVAYAGRLDKSKELSPLRAAPEWTQVQAIEQAVKTAYATGLDKGFFFVARMRDATPAQFNAEAQSRLDLNQEVYHLDAATGRYRRLTETGGHVFALNPSPDRKRLSFLVTSRLEHEAATGGDEFVDPQGGVLDLSSLETSGPFKLAARARVVSLVFAAGGEARWLVNAEEAYALDAARTAMVKVERGPGQTGTEPGSTVAMADKVDHFGAAPTGARRSDDGKAVVVDGNPQPLRSAREIAASSLEWSPSKKRLLYAGVLDACKVIKAGKAGKDDKNELFLYDADKKIATRIAAAVSSFDALWLDDDHVVYEGGIGKEGKLHVYDASARTETIVKSRAGAGLFGFPSLTCVEAAPTEASSDEPPSSGETEGD